MSPKLLNAVGAALFSLSAGSTVAATSPAAAVADYRIVAYVAGWSMPESIPAAKLTHINFAFARIDGEGRVVFEDPRYAAAIASIVELRLRQPRLKVLVSVGGWEAEGFSDAALTSESRKRFARSAVDLLRRHRLDGIDLDWEYPGQGVAGINYRPEDRENFTRLLQDVRAQLDAASAADGRAGANRYLLTIASADRDYFAHTEMDRLHVHLDWINVMAYDFFNSLTATTGHHAGLYASEFAAPTDRNSDASIRQHRAAGIPPGKLVLGVAFYGRRFEGVDPLQEGLHRPYARYGGDHSYAELANSYFRLKGFARHWDARARAPWLWNASTRTFITYEDPQSLRAKMQYVRSQGLGGVMFWELSQDRNGELLDTIRAGLQIGP
ncbi:MAG: glycoside hydrolase family 18 protein [Steroidobacteraceae bacterium]